MDFCRSPNLQRRRGLAVCESEWFRSQEPVLGFCVLTPQVVVKGKFCKTSFSRRVLIWRISQRLWPWNVIFLFGAAGDYFFFSLSLVSVTHHWLNHRDQVSETTTTISVNFTQRWSVVPVIRDTSERLSLAGGGYLRGCLLLSVLLN